MSLIQDDAGVRGVVSGIADGLFAVGFENGLVADFDVRHLPDVSVGDVVTAGSFGIQQVDLGRWTQEELDDARCRGREMARKFAELRG